MNSRFEYIESGDEVIRLGYNSKEEEYDVTYCTVDRWLGRQLIYHSSEHSCGVVFQDIISQDDLASDMVYVDFDSTNGNYEALFTSRQALKLYLESERDKYVEYINQTIESI